MNQLIIKDLHKSFGTQHVLKGVSFTVEKGEVLAVIGSSGSGKSTLLRCMNQLEVPDQGIVQLNDDKLDYTLDTPARKLATQAQTVRQWRTKVGMVFQQFYLWEHMTVLQNLIEAPLYVLKQAKAGVQSRAEALLTKMKIIDKKDSYPSSLSGGQQQRVAIARAMMMAPEVMLFDEPTSALDPEMVGEVISIIKQLTDEGMTMVVSTHEINFARKIADHVVFLDQGEVCEVGTKDILFNPQTERFKQFLSTTHH